MQNTDKKINQVIPVKSPFNIKDFHSPFIPKSFQLGGLTIDISYQKKLTEEGLMLGAADYVAQKILLDPTFTKIQTVEQAYFHELTHWILSVMGESELCSNEKFVDVFAHFLYQALTTAVPHSQPQINDNEIPLPDKEPPDTGSHEKVFSDEEIYEIHDYMEEDINAIKSSEYWLSLEEDAIEEEHQLACREAGFEDVTSYQEGMANSEEDGWFYGDDD